MASRETTAQESDREDATDDVEALLLPVPAGRPCWASREFLLGALSGVALPVLAASLGMWLLRGDISPDGGLVVRPAAWLLAVAALIAGLILALAVASFVRTRRQQRTNVALHEVVLTRLTRAEGSLAGLEASRSSMAPRPDMVRSAMVDRAVIRLQLDQIERYLGMAGGGTGEGNDPAAVPGVAQGKA